MEAAYDNVLTCCAFVHGDDSESEYGSDGNFNHIDEGLRRGRSRTHRASVNSSSDRRSRRRIRRNIAERKNSGGIFNEWEKEIVARRSSKRTRKKCPEDARSDRRRHSRKRRRPQPSTSDKGTKEFPSRSGTKSRTNRKMGEKEDAQGLKMDRKERRSQQGDRHPRSERTSISTIEQNTGSSKGYLDRKKIRNTNIKKDLDNGKQLPSSLKGGHRISSERRDDKETNNLGSASQKGRSQTKNPKEKSQCNGTKQGTKVSKENTRRSRLSDIILKEKVKSPIDQKLKSFKMKGINFRGKSTSRSTRSYSTRKTTSTIDTIEERDEISSVRSTASSASRLMKKFGSLRVKSSSRLLRKKLAGKE